MMVDGYECPTLISFYGRTVPGATLSSETNFCLRSICNLVVFEKDERERIFHSTLKSTKIRSEIVKRKASAKKLVSNS